MAICTPARRCLLTMKLEMDLPLVNDAEEEEEEVQEDAVSVVAAADDDNSDVFVSSFLA